MSDFPSEIRVTRLLLIGTGRYYPLYHRPYEITVNNDVFNSVANTLYENQNNINDRTFAGMGNSIFNTSASIDEYKGVIAIPNGWDERRIRFVMETENIYDNSDPTITYYQGYTNFFGVNPATKSIAPDMEFIINSYISVRRMVNYTPAGTPTVRDVIFDAGQVESGEASLFNQGNKYLIRPIDVFNGFAIKEMENGLTGDYNTSIVNGVNMLTSTPQTNNRANNIPSAYLSKILGSYNTATRTINLNATDTDLYRTAARQVGEVSAARIPLMLMFGANNMGGPRDRFSYRSLEGMDPTIYNRCQFIDHSQALMNVAGMDGEYWTGSDKGTTTASTLAQAIPALMTMNMITQIDFTATNMTMDGSVDFRIINAMGMTSADMTFLYDRFRDEFCNTLMFDLTSGLRENYSLSVSANIYGDTIIDIAIGDCPNTRFVMPSFCDSIAAPIVATNMSSYDDAIGAASALVRHMDNCNPNGLTLSMSDMAHVKQSYGKSSYEAASL